MPRQIVFGLHVVGTRLFIDRVASWLIIINGTARGRELITELKKSATGFVIEEVQRVDEALAYMTVTKAGVYKLEKCVLDKNWHQAVAEVRHATQHLADSVLQDVGKALTDGIPSVTYSEAVSRVKQPLKNIDMTDRYRKRAEKSQSYAVDTSCGVGEDSVFHQILEPNDEIDISKLVTESSLGGWYILLRKLRPHLQAGEGVKLGKVEVNEGAVAKKFGAGENPAVALVHELIHGLHFMQGKGYWNAAMEESQTVGLHPYEGERYTENHFRSALQGTGFQGQISEGRRIHY